MAEPGHRPGRKGHLALARLATGPACCAELRDAANAHGRRARDKLWQLIRSMLRDGLIERDAGFYSITPAGLDALERLRQGVAVVTSTAPAEPVPNVRLFEPRAA